MESTLGLKSAETKEKAHKLLLSFYYYLNIHIKS
jgi:hypothetical protein